ncbi:MAG: methyltransferase domain-containing protein [Eggerthellaceae bacterium]|nr:methyltransferase domain-containing protein [Eggerthellaceae bacterium]
MTINVMTDPRYIRNLLPEVPEEVRDTFAGTGAALPPALEGCTVVVAGCGTGREAYLAAKLVGETGRVIGIDACAESLAVARKYADAVANLEFREGRIDDAAAAGIEAESADVVIANCGLFTGECPRPLFEGIWNTLKMGGELYFTEVFANRRVEDAVKQNDAVRAAGLSRAVYQEDFRRMMAKVGWIDFRYMDSVRVPLEADVAAVVGETEYAVRTIRAFKLPEFIEDICEQYGQWATYEGGIPGMCQYFDLDDHHRFFLDVPMSVCGNSCCYVENTRYGKFFHIEGDRTHHVGPFSGCGKAPEPRDPAPVTAVAKCA